MRKIPVTVLTGFLGAGKTTLLNRILSENHGERIAVIENEFSEGGVHHARVSSADGHFFEMNNRCMCCTARGDLVQILGNLIKRRETFDRIWVETTWMANPGRVAQTFFADGETKCHFALDGIATVVDGKHIHQHLSMNLVMLRLSATQPAHTQLNASRAQRMWAYEATRVCEGPKGFRLRVPATGKFGIYMQHVRLQFEFALRRDRQVAAAVAYETFAARHTLDDEVGSVVLQLDGAVDAKRLNRWLGVLLSEKAKDSLFMPQGVHRLFEGHDDRPWGTERRASKLIFVGRKLNRNELTHGFERCLA